MTVDRLFNCSRPLYIETDIKGVEYGQIGSCCLLRSCSRLWVATARHCLWNGEQPTQEDIRATVERLWIPQRLGVESPSSIAFKSVDVVSSTTHAAAADIAALNVSSGAWIDASDFCDLSRVPLNLAREGDKLVVAGYPTLINEIQYPEGKLGGKLKRQRLVATGSFAGEGTAPGLSAVRLDSQEALASYNGMSGSPVFALRTEGLRSFALLAVLAVREMTSTGTIDFISAPVLENLLYGCEA